LGRVLGSVVYPVQGIRLMVICCGMAVKRLGMLGVSVRKMKALTVMMERVTLSGKCTRHVREVKIHHV
jgi:hypothetical protein